MGGSVDEWIECWSNSESYKVQFPEVAVNLQKSSIVTYHSTIRWGTNIFNISDNVGIMQTFLDVCLLLPPYPSHHIFIQRFWVMLRWRYRFFLSRFNHISGDSVLFQEAYWKTMGWFIAGQISHTDITKQASSDLWSLLDCPDVSAFTALVKLLGCEPKPKANPTGFLLSLIIESLAALTSWPPNASSQTEYTLA